MCPFLDFVVFTVFGDPKKYSCLIEPEMHIKEKFSRLKHFWITNELTEILIYCTFFVILQRYEYLKSDKRFENCPKCAYQFKLILVTLHLILGRARNRF